MDVTSEMFALVEDRMKEWPNEPMGLNSTLTALEREVSFDREIFLKAFCEALFHNGILRSPDPKEIFLIEKVMLSNTGRNYRMMDLLKAVRVTYYTRENFPRSAFPKIVRENKGGNGS